MFVLLGGNVSGKCDAKPGRFCWALVAFSQLVRVMVDWVFTSRFVIHSPVRVPSTAGTGPFLRSACCILMWSCALRVLSASQFRMCLRILPDAVLFGIAGGARRKCLSHVRMSSGLMTSSGVCSVLCRFLAGYPSLVLTGRNQGMGLGLSSLEGGGAGSPSMLATGENTWADGPASNGVLHHMTHVPNATVHAL